MRHSVTFHNVMLGEHTLSFESKAKTENGLLRAASNRIAREVGGYSSIMSCFTWMVAIDGHPVDDEPKSATKCEVVQEMRTRRDEVRDTIGYLSMEVCKIHGELIVLEAEHEKLCADIKTFTE